MVRALTATFVRTEGRDRIYVHRSDGSEVSWQFPTYGGNLPHDLVHLVVESGFGVRHGFWGRVDDGIDPARINQEANRGRGYAGFGADQRELLAAEGLAAVPWFDTALDDAQLCEEIAQSCASFGTDPPATVTPVQVGAVRKQLSELRERWRRDHKVRLTFDAHR